MTADNKGQLGIIFDMAQNGTKVYYLKFLDFENFCEKEEFDWSYDMTHITKIQYSINMRRFFQTICVPVLFYQLKEYCPLFVQLI